MAEEHKTQRAGDKPYLCMKNYGTEGWTFEAFATLAEAVKDGMGSSCYGCPVLLVKRLDVGNDVEASLVAEHAVAQTSPDRRVDASDRVQEAGEKPFLVLYRSDYNFSFEEFASLEEAVKKATESDWWYELIYARRLELTVHEVQAAQ